MKTNKYRVLLSEVLPYETPLFFDNIGFYTQMVTGSVSEKDLKELFRSTSYTIPFNYRVQRNARKGSRSLSVIHPVNQLSVVDFYKNYDVLLLQATHNSPFSLRYINAIAKLQYDVSKELIIESERPERELERDNEEQTKAYVSYFTYRSIDRMYKFFNEMPLFRLEQKYAMMRKLDVAGCFYHIYTHSVTWAVTSKEDAKASIGKKSFGNDFDELMQQCNYNETNGIVVGPEVSRIFAELILRRVDLNVLTDLKEKGLIFGNHYEIRRYVDDMMVFANDENILNTIESVVEKELDIYKLDLNKTKTTTQLRPFGTPISCCKQEVINVFDKYVDGIILNDEKSMESPYKVSLKFFRELRLIVSKYGVAYGDVNRMLLSFVSKTMRSINSKDSSDEIKTRRCVCMLDIAFYVFSLDITTTASLRLCRTILLSAEIIEGIKTDECKTEIREKLYREANRILSIYILKNGDENMPLEVINVLLAMKSLDIMAYDLEQLILLLGIKRNDKDYNCSSLNYFAICSLLLLAGNDSEFNELKISLQSDILNRFSEDWENKAELALLFLDLTVCPFLDERFKKKLWKCTHYNDKTRGVKRKLFSSNRWFFDWRMNKTTLDNYLKKKEYRPAYE